MDFEEFFDQTDRSMYAGLDAAMGRAFRALAEHEKSIHLALHAGLYGPDRQIVELITQRTSVSAALTTIRGICATSIIRAGDPALAEDVAAIASEADRIIRKRNQLVHQIIDPIDDHGRYFGLFSLGDADPTEVSAESLEDLRASARSSTLALYEVARRLTSVLHNLPAAEPTGHWIGVYARDVSRD